MRIDWLQVATFARGGIAATSFLAITGSVLTVMPQWFWLFTLTVSTLSFIGSAVINHPARAAES